MSERRSVVASLGLSLMSLLFPASGLVRVGKVRLALMLAMLVLAGGLIIRFGPRLVFASWLATAFVMAGGILAAVVLTFVEARRTPLRSTKRWPLVLGLPALWIAANIALFDLDRTRTRNFYVPSESMTPTLRQNDRFVADMRAPAFLRRGDVLLVRQEAGDIYLSRLVGLPGDRLELVGGALSINGHAVGRPSKPGEVIERLPGESGSHVILDSGFSSGDDFGPIIVPRDRYFFLGDNRDRSADSRFNAHDFGLGLVDRQRIIGSPTFFTWPSPRAFGTPVNSGEAN